MHSTNEISSLWHQVGFEVQGDEFFDIPKMNSSQIASRAFLQFEDVSAKFSVTARCSGDMALASVGSVGVDNATVAFAFGLGLAEVCLIRFLHIGVTVDTF
jgi:hypothetical protein